MLVKCYVMNSFSNENKPLKKVTLQTISQHTGYSKYAVSRALAGKSGGSEEVRTQIRRAAEELGYTKSERFQAKPIALILDDANKINSEINLQIQRGMQQEAAGLGHDVKVVQQNSNAELQELAAQIGGLIFVSSQETHEISNLIEPDFPCVTIGSFEPLAQRDIVRGTNNETSEAVAQHLYNLGHRHMVYVMGQRVFRGRRGGIPSAHGGICRSGSATHRFFLRS